MPLDHDMFAAINGEIMRIQAKEYRHERHLQAGRLELEQRLSVAGAVNQLRKVRDDRGQLLRLAQLRAPHVRL